MIRTLLSNLSAWDKTGHRYLVARFPKAAEKLDEVLNTIFNIASHAAFALIVCFVLAVLAASNNISVINAMCIGGAWLIAFVWIARSSFVRQLTIPSRVLSVTVLGIALSLAATQFKAWVISRERPRPSLPFIFGAPLGDNDSPVWIMTIEHYGLEPAFNCSLEFYDRDRKNIEHEWLVNHPTSSFPPHGFADGESQQSFHVPEVDLVGNAGNFQWTPLDPNHQHYSIEIVCRGHDGQFHEDWEVTRVGGVLRTSIKLERPAPAVERNPDLGREIFTCTDPEFYNAPLISTLPEAWPPHLVNPGWKSNHPFEMPVIIIDPNGGLEVGGVKGVASLGCWDILTKHFGDAE